MSAPREMRTKDPRDLAVHGAAVVWLRRHLPDRPTPPGGPVTALRVEMAKWRCFWTRPFGHPWETVKPGRVWRCPLCDRHRIPAPDGPR